MYGFDPIRYEESTALLVGFLFGLPPEALDFRPDIAGAWTIREHVVHLADGEVNALIRLKAILAEPGKTVYVYDEEKWTAEVGRHCANVTDHIELFRLVRKIILRLFGDVVGPGHENNAVTHPDAGRLDLKTWVEWYSEKHVDFHRKLMERNLDLWKSSGNDKG